MRRLKFILDRKSLETIYLSFIRPVLEYGDTIWENCTQYEKFKTRLHVLSSISETTRYNLKNADHYTMINCRTQLYNTSFVPSVVREWNGLPGAVKQYSSLHSFKVFLNQDRFVVPKYFNHGKRKIQVLHTRLRTGCSSVNNDLYLKQLIESPSCAFGATVENTYHFLFSCDRYILQRNEMSQALSDIPHINTRVLLRRDETLSLDTNILIFSAVQKYIESTKRF